MPPNGTQWPACQRSSWTDEIGKRCVGVVWTVTPGTRNGLFTSFRWVTAVIRPLRVRFLPACLSASTNVNASAMPATRKPSDGLPPGTYFLMIFAARVTPGSFANLGVAGSFPHKHRDRALCRALRVELHDRRRRRNVVDVDLRLPAELLRVNEHLDRELAEREDREGVGAAGLQLGDLRLHVGCRWVVPDGLHDLGAASRRGPLRKPLSRSFP